MRYASDISPPPLTTHTAATIAAALDLCESFDINGMEITQNVINLLKVCVCVARLAHSCGAMCVNAFIVVGTWNGTTAVCMCACVKSMRILLVDSGVLHMDAKMMPKMHSQHTMRWH